MLMCGVVKLHPMNEFSLFLWQDVFEEKNMSKISLFLDLCAYRFFSRSLKQNKYDDEMK